MIRVGFTGTRNGLTFKQSEQVRLLLANQKLPVVGHHGDCVGADEEFHNICHSFKCPIPVIIHPPLDSKYRAFCKNAVWTLRPRPYLSRNQDIVDFSSILIACPKEDVEPKPARGQGTWSTIRHARKIAGKAGYIVWPSGKVTKLSD